MKSLKTWALFVALLLIGTNISFAQSSNLSDEQKEEMAKSMEEFFTALDLSDEQKVEFEEISKKYAEQMQAVKEGGGRMLQKQQKIKSIRKEKNAEMKELLSADQYEIYLEKQEEMQQAMKEKRKQN